MVGLFCGWFPLEIWPYAAQRWGLDDADAIGSSNQLPRLGKGGSRRTYDRSSQGDMLDAVVAQYSG